MNVSSSWRPVPLQLQTLESGHILLTDDDPVTRYMVSFVLRQMGYAVTEADSGQACLDAYQACLPERVPELILVNACMPGGMSGFDCCRNLKNLPGSEHTPILMLTGLDDQDSVDCAFGAGAVDYITKPIHWPVLKHRVKVFIRQARLQQQLEVANAQLKALASLDEATGLANYRTFKERLALEWRRLMRESAPLALLLIDIDYFKRYNDTYGHVAGNECLAHVADVIQQAGRRPADLAARYGGEEFALLLPRTDLVGAMHVGKIIQQNLAELHLSHVASDVSDVVTVSIGAACVEPLPQQTELDLVTTTDSALYEAKTLGRNQVIGKAM